MVARFQDWYQFPKDSGLSRLDPWFAETVGALRGHLNDAYWEADTGLVFQRSAVSANSIRDNYTATTDWQVYYNATQYSKVSATEAVWYEDDGTTAILTLDRDATTKTAIFNKTIEADTFEADGGSVSSPAFSFNGDNDGGMYRPGANQVAIAANGSARINFGTTHTYIHGGNNSGAGAGGRVYLQTLNGTDIVSFDWNASAHTRMIVPSGRFDVVEDGGGTLDFRFANLGTTGNAANAYVTSASGQLNRSTSLRKYKWAISPIDKQVDFMAIKPRRFKWQPDVQDHRNREWSYGFIVEEAYEVSDGLVNLEKNEDGVIEPTDLDLRAILAVTVEEVQDLRKRVDRAKL